ncbi:hypothetical protein GDO81_004438, partial [Engystomops pustulosus]
KKKSPHLKLPKQVSLQSKKRQREETYSISDVMSKEDIISASKKCKQDSEDDVASNKLTAEDLERNGDSNSVIKDRLSQAVRQSAKHLLDPERKVDGQPVPYQQPKYFIGGIMRWYQIEGMEWLRMLWENGINGILADEMGLGKTVQCIATIAMMIERGVPGPFFVCGPLSTLPNWLSEFKRFCPEIPVLLYHGTPPERRELAKRINKPKRINKREGTLQVHPVVITSFEISMKDRQILQTQLAELWSLLNFLLPEVFDDLRSFESWFDIAGISQNAEDLIAKEREQNILHMLHQILTPFLLRRLKSDVALEVPPKREVVVYAPLTKKQETFYTAIVNRTIVQMLGKEKSSESLIVDSKGRGRRKSRKVVNYNEKETPDEIELLIKNMMKQPVEVEKESLAIDVAMPVDAEVKLQMRNTMMLLRKCVNHPYLIEYPLDPYTQEFKATTLSSSPRKFKFCRLDGSMSFSEREENMREFNTDPEVFIFLVSTRAGGLGINLTAADTVIIYDSDWNPQADLQAQDRCHRIGQTRPVVVYRLVTANTIDQKIVERAAAKRKLEKLVIHKSKFDFFY